MNSFIPWVGGKSQLRNEIVKIFPQDIEKYVEVFGGAAWVLFAKDKHAPIEVFNDLDSNLINLYRCIQYHCGELQKELELGGEQVILNSREMFFDYMEQVNMRGLTDIQRAARYYYIIRASFGANRSSFCCTKRGFNGVLNKLPEIQQRLKNVVIENRDFEKLIKTYNKPSTLYYLDPPYYKAEDYYQGFGAHDHQRLQEAIVGIKGQFILSYNDAPEIRELYKAYNIREVERCNNLACENGAGRPSYRELIITNY